MTEWFFNLGGSQSKTSYGKNPEINPFVILNKQPNKKKNEEFEKLKVPSTSREVGEKHDVSEFVVIFDYNEKKSTYKSHVVNLNSKKNRITSPPTQK